MDILRKKIIARSILFGFAFSIIILFLLHLFGNWYLSPEKEKSGLIVMTMIVRECYNECKIFNKTHSTGVYTEEDKQDAKHLLNNFKIRSSFKFTFDNHWSSIFFLCLFTIPLVYIFMILKNRLSIKYHQ